MAVIGNNIYAFDGSGSAAFMGSRFLCPANGTINSITVYVQLGNYAGRSIAVGIYDDNAGAIGTILNYSADTAVPALQDGWMTITIPSTTLVNGNYYWLIVQYNTSLGGYTWYIKNGSANQRGYKSTASYPYWTSPPTGVTYDNYKYLIYSTITEISTKTKTILSDAKIKVFDNQKTIASDAVITSTVTKTIQSDTHIQALDIEETILSDAKIIDQYEKTITSDATIKAIIQKTITSDAKVVIPILVDFVNYVNFTKQALIDTINDCRIVKRVLSDVNNFINTVKGLIYDTNNDFRTQKRKLNNISNDVRFLLSWQKAADGSFQSLGKEYIKVYINSVEQTDADVDSINISKDVNGAHTASFDLGRAYDASKPDAESEVEIKYHNWILYSGYVTQINPTEDPEKIRINCQDEYWKQNKINKYYQVGHKPTDDQELYYATSKIALSTEHGWNLNIGDFVPQTIDNFGTGSSDAITNLIENCSNYGWFYDVDKSKKLWTAGEGSVININRQELGKNIGLYDLIEHSFSEDVESIINKFRVQMGEKVIRKFNSTGGNRSYAGYNYSSYNAYVTPAWDRTYERLAKPGGHDYGFNYHKPEDAELYKDIFKKYYMPYLDSKLSSWSDRYPPYVQIYGTGSIFGAASGRLFEGFTIDYENKLIIFNNPIYIYKTDSRGEIISLAAPIIKAFLYRKNYYAYTTDPSEDPETDVTNPLMFFTDKMGDYPETIVKDLNLSSLSIQEGGTTYTSGSTDEIFTYTGGDKIFQLEYTGQTTMYVNVNGVYLNPINYTYNSISGKVTILSALNIGDAVYFAYNYTESEIIPSWDDTEFARDYANWQLSKNCDKKIKAQITLTLDCLCYNNIDLTKRIFINGISESAMNITSIDYDMDNFTVRLALENNRNYKRNVSLESRGE